MKIKTVVTLMLMMLVSASLISSGFAQTAPSAPEQMNAQDQVANEALTKADAPAEKHVKKSFSKKKGHIKGHHAHKKIKGKSGKKHHAKKKKVIQAKDTAATPAIVNN